MGLRRGLWFPWIVVTTPGETARRFIAAAASRPWSANNTLKTQFRGTEFWGGVPFRFMRASWGIIGGGIVVMVFVGEIGIDSPDTLPDILTLLSGIVIGGGIPVPRAVTVGIANAEVSIGSIEGEDSRRLFVFEFEFEFDSIHHCCVSRSSSGSISYGIGTSRGEFMGEEGV